MTLSTMQPEPTWDESANAATVDTFADVASEISVLVWGGDWCGDCRRELPAVAAALEAAGIPENSISIYEVDQEKSGPRVDAYDIQRLPTIIVERDGDELARFEESATQPAPMELAAQIQDR